jgi:hypothetical protein
VLGVEWQSWTIMHAGQTDPSAEFALLFRGFVRLVSCVVSLMLPLLFLLVWRLLVDIVRLEQRQINLRRRWKRGTVSHAFEKLA